MVTAAFAKVGIIAFIDEVTGYQELRERDELTTLLSLYLTEERLAWAKMFPEEFYKQIYRLRGGYIPHQIGAEGPLCSVKLPMKSFMRNCQTVF